MIYYKNNAFVMRNGITPLWEDQKIEVVVFHLK